MDKALVSTTTPNRHRQNRDSVVSSSRRRRHDEGCSASPQQFVQGNKQRLIMNIFVFRLRTGWSAAAVYLEHATICASSASKRLLYDAAELPAIAKRTLLSSRQPAGFSESFSSFLIFVLGSVSSLISDVGSAASLSIPAASSGFDGDGSRSFGKLFCFISNHF